MNLCTRCKINWCVEDDTFVCEACDSLILKEKSFLTWRDWFSEVWETSAYIIESEWGDDNLPLEYDFDEPVLCEAWWR